MAGLPAPSSESAAESVNEPPRPRRRPGTARDYRSAPRELVGLRRPSRMACRRERIGAIPPSFPASSTTRCAAGCALPRAPFQRAGGGAHVAAVVQHRVGAELGVTFRAFPRVVTWKTCRSTVRPSRRRGAGLGRCGGPQRSRFARAVRRDKPAWRRRWKSSTPKE